MKHSIRFPRFLICWLISGSMLFAQEWADITPASGDTPAPRRNSAAIYDPVDHRMILFAGRAASGDQNDVWAFDLTANLWSNITPAAGPAPAPRFTPNAVYDAPGHQMIIWSGQGAAFYNDVWAFDLTSESWSQFTPPDPKPNIRYGTAAVFDPLARDLVTFAGFTNLGRFDDTWRFDVPNSVWINVTPAQGNPTERCLHSASYDSVNHRMIMYGGQQSGPLGDIWAFDLIQDNWAELTPSNSPPGRYFATNIYDANNHRAIIFGGNRASGGGLANEAWGFNLTVNEWQQLNPSGTAPAEREGSVAVYIHSQDRMIAFGGRGAGSVLFNDVWSLNDLSQSTGIGDENPGELSAGFELYQNYPNPFNPETNIGFRISDFGFTELKIYDVLGREIKTLVEQELLPGSYEVEWDGTNNNGLPVSSGIYLYQLQANNLKETRRMILMR